MKVDIYIVKRKMITCLLISASLAAFAALGDGKKDNGKNIRQRSLLSSKNFTPNFKTFSLKSGYSYRGGNLFSKPKTEEKYIMLNTVVTYQRGNSTYIMPLKKKVLLDKINFHPIPPNKY